MIRIAVLFLLLCAVPGMGQVQQKAPWKAEIDSFMCAEFGRADQSEANMILPSKEQWQIEVDIILARHDKKARLKRTSARSRERADHLTMREYRLVIDTIIVQADLQELRARIDSLEAMLRRAHVVEVRDSIAIPGCGYWWSSPGWYRNEWDSIPAQIAERDTCWEYTTHYGISFNRKSQP